MSTKSVSLHLSNRLSSQSLIRKTGSSNFSSGLTNPMTQTSPNFVLPQKNLPSLNASDANQSLFLKQSFEEFSDSVSQFLCSSNSTVSYRDSISTRLTEITHNFESFYSYFQRQNCSRYQNRNTNLSNRSTFKTLATTFSTNITQLVEELDSIRNSGGSDIVNSLKTNYDKVLGNLQQVLTHPNQRLSVHDPIIPIAKNLRMQINTIKKNTLKIIENENGEHIDQYHLLIEMRNLSSDLNNAFTNEFTRCSYGMNENEKLRAISMTACNDILQGTKSLINFKAQILTSLETFEKFRKKINVVFSNSGIPPLTPILPPVEEEEEDKNEPNNDSPILLNHNHPINANNNTDNVAMKEPEIYSSLTLKEILVLSREYITKNSSSKKFCDKFFSVLNSKADIIESKEINHLGQITDLQSKYSDLTTKARILEQQNQNLRDNLTLQQNKDHTDNYFKCIKYLSQKIQDYLEDGVPPNGKSLEVYDKTRNVIDNACEMADKLKDKRCPNCTSLETNCARVKEILLSIDNVKDSNNLIVVAESAHDSYQRLHNSFRMLSQNLHKAENDNDESKSQINIILKEFPSADLNNPDICGEIIKQIHEEREFNNRQIETETSNSRQRLSKFERDISNKYSQTFGTDPSLPLMSQFKAIQTELKNNKESISHLQSVINDTKNRLSKYLSITSDDRTIPDLLDLLESKPKNTESFSEQEKQCITQLNDCENRILSLLARDNSNPKSTFSAAIRSLMLAVNSLSEHIDGIDQNERLKKSYLSQVHSSLEMIHLKLIQFLHVKEDDDVNHSKMNINDLVARVGELIEKVIQSSSSASNLSAAVINKMFQNVMQFVSLNTREEPSLYLPEISTNYKIYHESIEALKPFADTLNRIFQNLEGKANYFASDSSSLKMIKQEVFQMHSSLNQINPSKVHSVMFLVLSRFVALTSSFISAMSTKS